MRIGRLFNKFLKHEGQLSPALARSNVEGGSIFRFLPSGRGLIASGEDTCRPVSSPSTRSHSTATLAALDELSKLSVGQMPHDSRSTPSLNVQIMLLHLLR